VSLITADYYRGFFFFPFSAVFCEINGLHWREWFPVTVFLSNKIWKKLGTCITLNA